MDGGWIQCNDRAARRGHIQGHAAIGPPPLAALAALGSALVVPMVRVYEWAPDKVHQANFAPDKLCSPRLGEEGGLGDTQLLLLSGSVFVDGPLLCPLLLLYSTHTFIQTKEKAILHLNAVGILSPSFYFYDDHTLRIKERLND